MRCTILASGSKGNSVFLEGDSGAILIDAGLSAKEAFQRAADSNLDVTKVNAVLVTHEHGDHVRGLDVIARKLNVPIYATEGTLRDFLNHRRTSSKPLDSRVVRYQEKFSVAGFDIEPFAISHDAAEPCGFSIKERDISFCYCTDTGIVTPGMHELFRHCDGMVLESNHCPDMLENGPYPEYLKRRIRSKKGHLSNPAAASCLQSLGKDIPLVILAHLSETNNTPERAMGSARNGLGLFFDENVVRVATQRGSCRDCPQCISL
jgi:phosphoribosyl 1,2-cyclic phosphodiesterase